MNKYYFAQASTLTICPGVAVLNQMPLTCLLSKNMASVGELGVRSPCRVVPLKLYSTTTVPSLTSEKLDKPRMRNEISESVGKAAALTVTF